MVPFALHTIHSLRTDKPGAWGYEFSGFEEGGTGDIFIDILEVLLIGVAYPLIV